MIATLSACLFSLLSSQDALRQADLSAQATANRAAEREILLRRRISALYRFQRGGALQLLAESRDPVDTSLRLENARRVIARDLVEIAAIRQEHAELARMHDLLVARLEEIERVSGGVSMFDTREGRLALPVPVGKSQPALGGLLFRTLPGAVVSAVAAGRVLYAGPIPGFDDVVLIDHGGSLVSLYAHLAPVAVRVDEIILEGAVLGRVVDRSLFFELRRNAEPIAAAPWFRKTLQ